MKKIYLIAMPIIVGLFIMGAIAGVVILKSYTAPDNISTGDLAYNGTEDETDDVIFIRPEETPTPTTPTPTVTPDNPEETPEPTDPPVTLAPTPTPGPEDYYKNPYITQANTTWVYDKIYKSGKAQQSANSYNILILVADWSSGSTDSIIVINFNQDSGRITTLSIPRDCYVKLPNGENGKINEIYCGYGVSKLCDYIKGFTGIDINYYVVITGDTVKTLVDAVGGIDYNVPVDIPPLGLYKGIQHLDGSKAVDLLRFRNFYYYTDDVSDEQLAWYNGSDISRVKTAIGFIQAFAEQKFALEYILNINGYINIVLDDAETNIKTDTLLSMINVMFDHYGTITRDENFNSYYLGGKYDDTKYYNKYGKMWVWEVNDCMVNYNVNKAYYTEDIFNKMFKTKYPGLASF